MTQDTGLAASVHARLLNKARESGRTFNELLQYFAMERFLYRLSQSPHRDRFVLKGALMLAVWDSSLTRPTMDIDFLGRLQNDPDYLAAAVQELCRQDVAEDGVVFDEESIRAERIVEEAEYAGVRVRFQGRLGKAKIPMQLDIGFGDLVVPEARLSAYPTILDSPVFEVRGYSRESTIAEKFEAMVKLGRINSRMKDFYDIRLLSRQFEFRGELLAKAIQATFERRRTALEPGGIQALSELQQDPNKAKQWDAFLARTRLERLSFEDAMQSIIAFLGPVVEALSAGRAFTDVWAQPGSWKRRTTS